jgi:hypothetical protein
MPPNAVRKREAIARARVEGMCIDCREETSFRVDRADEYYMVRDALWRKAHPQQKGKLCIGCLERRLGCRLRPRDFTDAPINRFLRGSSDRLASRVMSVPEDAVPLLRKEARKRTRRSQFTNLIEQAYERRPSRPNLAKSVR